MTRITAHKTSRRQNRYYMSMWLAIRADYNYKNHGHRLTASVSVMVLIIISICVSDRPSAS